MRRILALSVLACLAASPAFAWGTSSGAGRDGTGASAGGAGIGTGNHSENDARGGFGPVGQVEGIRWDDELGCIEGTLTRCNK
jgi:hypothetical protein